METGAPQAWASDWPWIAALQPEKINGGSAIAMEEDSGEEWARL